MSKVARGKRVGMSPGPNGATLNVELCDESQWKQGEKPAENK